MGSYLPAARCKLVARRVTSQDTELQHITFIVVPFS